MGAGLTDIADLEGEGVAELMLDRQVPLLGEGRPEILIKDPYSDALIASDGDVGASRDGSEAIFDGASSRILLKNTKRHVLCELLVRAPSFREGGDAVAGSDDGLAMQGRR